MEKPEHEVKLEAMIPQLEAELKRFAQRHQCAPARLVKPEMQVCRRRLHGWIVEMRADYPLPILVVQHTTAGYANTCVDWLRAETPVPVEVAKDGQPLGRRGIYVAPSECHLVVRGRHLALLDAPPCSLHRPSASVLFKSVAHAFGPRAIGVLLTGMGDDGATGLAEMRQAGAVTVAQDEGSCVVYGMPAEAIRLGAADHVLAPEDIAGLLVKHAASRKAVA